jgi:hypothetical protein
MEAKASHAKPGMEHSDWGRKREVAVVTMGQAMIIFYWIKKSHL